jgi:hypothetical protein
MSERMAADLGLSEVWRPNELADWLVSKQPQLSLTPCIVHSYTSPTIVDSITLLAQRFCSGIIKSITCFFIILQRTINGFQRPSEIVGDVEGDSGKSIECCSLHQLPARRHQT